jgi:hypothetical protein
MVSAYSLCMSFNYTIRKQVVLHIRGEKYERRRRFCYISVTFYSLPFKCKCFIFFHDSIEKILLQIIRCTLDFICLKVYIRSSGSTPKQMSPFVDTRRLWTSCFRSIQIFQNSISHLKTLDSRSMTSSMGYNEHPQLSGATVQNLVARAIQRSSFGRTCRIKLTRSFKD